jgi:general stress protein YciG
MENAISKAAAEMGRKGGSVGSDAQKAAARENGRKGGRPQSVWRLFGDCVRLHRDGRVEHFDQDLCCYRPGWGPWAHYPRIGETERVMSDWEASRA